MIFGGSEQIIQDVFKGDVLHSSEFKSSSTYMGKKALVVGACTSGMRDFTSCMTEIVQTTHVLFRIAHDIAQDLYEKEVDVTMLQRSSTYVISAKAIEDMLGESIFSSILIFTFVFFILLMSSGDCRSLGRLEPDPTRCSRLFRTFNTDSGQ